MSLNPEIQAINDLRLRIVKARDLRAEGRTAEADALDPSAEELRRALIALRKSRESAMTAKLQQREKRAAIASMDLNDLFKPKDGGAA